MAANFSVCNFFIIWCSYHENVHILQIVMTCLLLFVWYSGKEFHWTHCGRKSSFTPHGVFVLRINPTSKQFPPFWQLPGLHNHCNYVFSTSWKKERDVTNVIVLFTPEDMSEELGRVSVRKKQNGRSGGSTGKKSHKFPVVRRILFNNYDSSC